MKSWLQVGVGAIVVVLAVSVFVAWRAVRQEQAQLQEKLKVAEAAVLDASAREATRGVALQQQLAEIQRQKKAVQRPEDVVKALPGVLPLPTAITLSEGSGVSAAQTESRFLTRKQSGAGMTSKTVGMTNERAANPNNGASPSNAATGDLKLPAEDLKPLYDFALECKACQAELGAAQADLKDEKLKTQALGRERDSALQAAKGGSVLRRVARAAKWFAIGAAAGAVAAKMAH